MAKTVIVIVTDLEGISGVDTIDMVLGSGYPEACRRLMADTNAAVSGAFAGGADEVLVVDGHGGGKNFPAGSLDPRAVLVRLSDSSIDMHTVSAFMAVGAHAMPGTINGFLDHVQSSVSWHDYLVNGRKGGELAQGGIFAGAYGIPYVMVSGDKAACAEGRAFFGDIAVAEVKTASGRNLAFSVSSEEAERRIFEAAKEGISLIGKIKPYKPHLPLEIVVEFNRTDYAEEALSRRDDAERIDARTVRRVVEQVVSYRDVLM